MRTVISKIRNVLSGCFRGPRGGPLSDAADWCADPLAHPALARMSMDELADLPLAARCQAAASGNGSGGPDAQAG